MAGQGEEYSMREEQGAICDVNERAWSYFPNSLII